MSPRTGRPKAENPKDIRFSVCIDAETLQELDAFCLENSVSKGEAIRQGLLLLFRKQKRNRPSP